ncbi:MAG: FG-GAP repeat domain-containing protein [Fimbriimonadaceae bacterium]
MKRQLILLTTLAVASSAAFTQSNFASSVVSSTGLGTNPLYNNPQAMLGAPSTWIRDTFDGGPLQQMAVSIVYGAWNVDPQNNNVICTVPPGGEVVVRFDPPITRNPRNWYGADFIVYGNSAFTTSNGWAQWNTNYALLNISQGAPLFEEPTTISVSPDGVQWYTYDAPRADSLWPTQAFTWNAGAQEWGPLSDAHKPVPPSLVPMRFSANNVADSITLMNRSYGGTAFSLAQTPFSSIQYVRVTGSGGEVDAMSRVLPKPRQGNDLLLVQDGALYLWRLLRGEPVAWLQLTTSLGDYEVTAAGDANGDGYDDIAFRSPSSGHTVVWYGNDLGEFEAETLLFDSPWRLSAIGDITGNGQDDLVWHNPQTGVVSVWKRNGSSFEPVTIGACDTSNSSLEPRSLVFLPSGQVWLLWNDATTLYGWRLNTAAEVVEARLVGFYDSAQFQPGAVIDQEGTGVPALLFQSAQGTVGWQFADSLVPTPSSVRFPSTLASFVGAGNL